MHYFVLSSLDEEERAGCFAFIVFRMFFYLILHVPSTIFQLNRDGSSGVEPVLS